MELVIKLFCYHDPAHAPPLLGGRRGQGYRLFSTIFYHKHERTCLGFIVRIQEGFDIIIAHTQMKCHCAYALCLDGHWKWSPTIYFEIAARHFIIIILYVVEEGNQVNIHDRQFYFHPVQHHHHCSFSPYCQGLLLRDVSFIVRFLILWYF